MNLLSFNVRGLGGDHKKREIRDLIRKERVGFVCIQETKMEVIDKHLCVRLWGEECGWAYKGSRGNSGGLLCMWDPGIFYYESCFDRDGGGLEIKGCWGQSKIPCSIVNVYMPCNRSERYSIFNYWKEEFADRPNQIICFVGDFNTVRKASERKGRSLSTPPLECSKFEDFISVCGLEELKLVGRKYTWYRDDGSAMSWIDRVFLNGTGMECWRDAAVWASPRTISDHCAIVLRNAKTNWGHKPFKFLNSWLQKPGFIQFVKNSWDSYAISGSESFKIKEKLKFLKIDIKRWCAENCGNHDRIIAETTASISALDSKAEVEDLCEADVRVRRGLFDTQKSAKNAKACLAYQQAKASWVKFGDENSRFFHSCISRRRRTNEIHGFEVRGTWCQEPAAVKKEVRLHFENFFKCEQWDKPSLGNVEGNKLSISDNEILVRAISEEEIRTAVWECGIDKSPGPDGFNFLFLRKTWNVIKKDVIGFVQEFERSGKFVKGGNASFVTLIPKNTNPTKIEEYRPIALVGCMYKLISKILANRIKIVLPNLIGKEQTAFIEQRHLLDGALALNEIIDEINKKKKEAFLFKIDFAKAYDSIRWDFLDDIMSNMNFCDKWRKWIAGCLSSATVSILVNGSPTAEFSPQKGLRQGDPIAPFLFLLVAESLNRFVKRAVNLNLFSPISIGRNEVKVSIMQFADDTIILGSGDMVSICTTKAILRWIEILSGLVVNFHKSNLFSFNKSDSWAREAEACCNCTKGSMPLVYLGIPVGYEKKSDSIWNGVVAKFRRKLDEWSSRNLSIAGKVTLINSVLNALPTFLFSLFLAPTNIINTLLSIQRNFLWGGSCDKQKIAWVKWGDVCKKKECGGLGVKDLKLFNKTLLSKWVWRLVSEGRSEGLWRSILISKYGVDWIASREGWVRNSGKIKKKASWWLRDILNSLEGDFGRHYWEGMRLVLGRGDKIRFWEDPWCNGNSLKSDFPRLFNVSNNKGEMVCSMGYWNRMGEWEWKFDWRRPLFVWESALVVNLLNVIGRHKPNLYSIDRWTWILNSDWSFTSRSLYDKVQSMDAGNDEANSVMSSEARLRWGRIWKTKATGKSKIFAWRVLQNRIATKANLARRNIDLGSFKCPRCDEVDEDSNHLFSSCKFAKDLWSMLYAWFDTYSVSCANTLNHFSNHQSLRPSCVDRRLWDELWISAVWGLWKSRNCIIFSSKIQEVKDCFDSCCLRLWKWLKFRHGRGRHFTYSCVEWMENPTRCLCKAG
ncbi:hypothetical protein ACS0TY_036118 [Phlomoides rotata]